MFRLLRFFVRKATTQGHKCTHTDSIIDIPFFLHNDMFAIALCRLLMLVGLFQRQLFGSSACSGDDAWWQHRGLGAHGWGRPLQRVCQEALHPPRPWWLKIWIYHLRQENIRSDSKWPLPFVLEVSRSYRMNVVCLKSNCFLYAVENHWKYLWFRK